MDSVYLWLLAGSTALAALALWKPSTSQLFVLRWLLIFALISGGGHALAGRFGHPEHAELGIWSYAALAFLCLLLALHDSFDIPGTRGAHVPAKARRLFRVGFAVFGLVFLAFGVHRDHKVVALYQHCQALYVLARTQAARDAAGAQVLDSTLRADAPSAHNPGPALTCRHVMEP